MDEVCVHIIALTVLGIARLVGRQTADVVIEVRLLHRHAERVARTLTWRDLGGLIDRHAV